MVVIRLCPKPTVVNRNFNHFFLNESVSPSKEFNDNKELQDDVFSPIMGLLKFMNSVSSLKMQLLEQVLYILRCKQAK